MANFNSSEWHHLYVNGKDGEAMWGTNLYKNSERGAVYFNTTDLNRKINRWQLFGVNPTTYVLRTQEGGSNAYLGTKSETKEDTPGRTQALMIRGDLADDSIYWTIQPWGDGTFYLYNIANRTSWHLNKDSGSATMSSNITAPQNGQRFSLKPIKGAIVSEPSFSIINVPIPTVKSSATVSSASFASSTSTIASASGAVESRLGGLSTGDKVGISVGIITIVGMLLVIVGILSWRRRKQKSQIAHHAQIPSLLGEQTSYEVEPNTVKYEMYDNAAKHEMPGTQTRAPIELPNNAMCQNDR
ncbi:hypothetical protein B0J11DRAFT_308006 [Dendryphion nanum]|uniref:Uncharacterized protein n=1 Tax=Dendryphion nanum TaxID=256645 RepID=A0A9P9IM37_9PLEO|nr:hypothetical protein B0J11DRAFT_308006 [Dendryphion nanum]